MMQIYTIHLPPPFSAKETDPEVLREGFNFAAFLFTFIWALFHRMWLMAALLFLAAAALGFVTGIAGLARAGEIVVSLAFMGWVGAEANDWRRRNLARRGWREVAVVAAPDAETALRRYADLAAIAGPRARVLAVRSDAPQPPHEDTTTPASGGAPA